MAAHFCAPADKRSGRRDIIIPILGPFVCYALPLCGLFMLRILAFDLDSDSHKYLDPVSFQKLQQVLPLWDAPQDGRPFFPIDFCCCLRRPLLLLLLLTTAVHRKSNRGLSLPRLAFWENIRVFLIYKKKAEHFTIIYHLVLAYNLS